MTTAAAKPFLWRMLLLTAIALAIVSVTVFPIAGERFTFRLHAPAWELWGRLPAQIQIHLVAALAAIVVGFVVISLPKGSRLHKSLGWAWVAAMGLTAVSSFFVTTINHGSFSVIHILSGWTLVALPLGIYAIRRRNVLGHRRAMTGLFFGGLLVAGALTFLPGRFMYQLFFG